MKWEMAKVMNGVNCRSERSTLLMSFTMEDNFENIVVCAKGFWKQLGETRESNSNLRQYLAKRWFTRIRDESRNSLDLWT